MCYHFYNHFLVLPDELEQLQQVVDEKTRMISELESDSIEKDGVIRELQVRIHSSGLQLDLYDRSFCPRRRLCTQRTQRQPRTANASRCG